MASAPKYFMYFPGNYRWSAAFVNMLGTAAFGGVDISELHHIGRLLEGKKADDDEAWFAACNAVANIVRGHAEQFRAERNPLAAASFHLRACHYFQMGERFRTPKDAHALEAYRKAVDSFHEFVNLSGSRIEIVDVPFEGNKLPGVRKLLLTKYKLVVDVDERNLKPLGDLTITYFAFSKAALATAQKAMKEAGAGK